MGPRPDRGGRAELDRALALGGRGLRAAGGDRGAARRTDPGLGAARPALRRACGPTARRWSSSTMPQRSPKQATSRRRSPSSTASSSTTTTTCTRPAPSSSAGVAPTKPAGLRSRARARPLGHRARLSRAPRLSSRVTDARTARTSAEWDVLVPPQDVVQVVASFEGLQALERFVAARRADALHRLVGLHVVDVAAAVTTGSIAGFVSRAQTRCSSSRARVAPRRLLR